MSALFFPVICRLGMSIPGHLPLGDVDELDAGSVQLLFVLGKVTPVGVSLLDDNLALLQQPLQD
jgi:hypothetical protein